MNKLIALIVFGLVFSFGVMSRAQTPDDMTPAEEDVCDVLEGSAYGLCNAYCEAMDCDSEEAQASDEACEKVLGNYETKTDVRMPCLGCLNDTDCDSGQVCISGVCCNIRPGRCEDLGETYVMGREGNCQFLCKEETMCCIPDLILCPSS